MARRPSKHLRAARPLSAHHGVSAARSDGRWVVRTVPGSAAVKPYRCPGCAQVVTVGTPHVVVWPAERSSLAATGVAERRHWHTGCWQRHR